MAINYSIISKQKQPINKKVLCWSGSTHVLDCKEMSMFPELPWLSLAAGIILGICCSSMIMIHANVSLIDIYIVYLLCSHKLVAT